MAETINFTKKERYIIAEYIYSYNTDLLIIQDAYNVLELLNKYQIFKDGMYNNLLKQVENKKAGIADKIYKIVSSIISQKQGDEIMNEYFKNKITC